MSDPEKKLALRAVGLSKSFSIIGGAKLEVLEGIKMELKEASSLSIRGESGCGKTTTLRLIAGHETASDGSVLISNREVTGAPPARRRHRRATQRHGARR